MVCAASLPPEAEEHDWCSVTRITPCGLRSFRAVWSTWSEFNPPAQLLGPGKPLCCRRCASRHKSSTSKSVTGTQSLSRSTMWRPGQTRQRAAKTKVPAQATGLADREENHITEFSSRALHASTARPPGCHCRPML